jgi:hypothetical protein
MAEEKVGPGRSIREDMARRYAIGCLRAAAWVLAAVLTGFWVYTILLSPAATGVFTGWAGFYR